MARKSTKSIPANVPAGTSATTNEVRLKGFFPTADAFENFRCCRYYWLGDGPRSGLLEKLDRKRFPVPAEEGSDGPTAAHTDYIPPPFAPAEYISFEHTVRRYEELMPPAEAHAYVQFTVEFPRPFNLAHPFEMVRAWAKRAFADGRHLPVFLALHAPGLAGSANPVHVHAVVLPRRLTQLGFGEFDRELPHDKGRRFAYESWLEFRRSWFEEWPSFLADLR